MVFLWFSGNANGKRPSWRAESMHVYAAPAVSAILESRIYAYLRRSGRLSHLEEQNLCIFTQVWSSPPSWRAEFMHIYAVRAPLEAASMYVYAIPVQFRSLGTTVSGHIDSE